MGKISYFNFTTQLLLSRYDPTEQREWGRFRHTTMGDSSMLTAKDKIEDWRSRGDSFGQRFGNNTKII